MADPVIRVERLGRRFASGTQALTDATLSVAAGEFVALLGPSGCGKSTLLRLVAGLDAPSEGAVHLQAPAGPGGLPPVGFVFQEPTLMPWASVADNVWLPLRLAGQSRAQAQAAVQAQLDAVGLRGFENAYPRELSGGMRMRVSIARALVAQPGVLLMDEPFAALDEITRLRLNEDLLGWWAARALTVLFVTHSVFEAVTLAQRIVVMSARPGRIAEVIDNPGGLPRDDHWRGSPDFAARCARVSQALRRAAEAQTGATAP
ncbi:MAG: ABC transporter ATP-binding protein [Betaproteobacteria bacterium]|nr:ABC transporter ATP-binding protein [Betaproteobacteria bacterium]